MITAKTTKKRIRYYYSKLDVEMLWAVNPATDNAWWWSNSDGWRASQMEHNVCEWFEKQDHLIPVSLYQVQHMNPKAYKPNENNT